MKYLLPFIVLASILSGQVTPRNLQSDNYDTGRTSKGGVVLSGDMIDGIMYPYTKLRYGTDGSATVVDTLTPLPVMETRQWGVEVAGGRINDQTYVLKFGAVTGVGTAEITLWSGHTRYEYIDEVGGSSRILSVASDDTDDNASGTGARTVYLEGLDTNYNVIFDIVTLDGLDSVDTSIEFFRIYQATVLTAGSQNENDGIIDIGVGAFTAGSADTVYALIDSTVGQAQMMIYTVPADFTAYFMDVRLTSNEGKSVMASGWAKPFGGAWIRQGTWYVFQSAFAREFPIPLVIPEKTDVELRVKSSASGTDISAAFTVLLIPN